MSTQVPVTIQPFGDDDAVASSIIPTDNSVDMGSLEAAVEYIRPAVQADGGDIFVEEVREGDVAIRMVGACEGCPMSMMTLRAGIERLLTDMVPGVVSVTAR